MRVVFAFTAYIFDPGSDVLEALSMILCIPLGGCSIVRPQMLLRAAAPPLRQTLLGRKSGEGCDRARLASVTRCPVTVTLISRVLEGVFLARCPAGLSEDPLMGLTAGNLSNAFSHRDLLELHHLRTVQFTLLYEPFEALLERRIAGPGRWSRVCWRAEVTDVASAIEFVVQFFGAGSSSSGPDLLEEADSVPQSATTWGGRTCRAGPAAGRTSALRWSRHDSLGAAFLPLYLAASHHENSYCPRNAHLYTRPFPASARFTVELTARGHLFFAHHTLPAPPCVYRQPRLPYLAGRREKHHQRSFVLSFFLFFSFSSFSFLARVTPVRLISRTNEEVTSYSRRTHAYRPLATMCDTRLPLTRNALWPRTTAAGSILLPLFPTSRWVPTSFRHAVPSVPSYTPRPRVLVVRDPHCTMTRRTTTTTTTTTRSRSSTMTMSVTTRTMRHRTTSSPDDWSLYVWTIQPS